MAKQRIQVKINSEVKVPQPVGNSINWRYTFTGRLFYATNGKYKVQLRVKKDCTLLVNLEGSKSWVVEEKRPKDPIRLELWSAGLTKKFEVGLVKDSDLAQRYKNSGKELSNDWFYFNGGVETPINPEYYGYFDKDVISVVPDKTYLIPLGDGDLRIFSNQSLTIVVEGQTPPWDVNIHWKTVGFALSPNCKIEEVEELIYEWVKAVRPHHLIKDEKYKM